MQFDEMNLGQALQHAVRAHGYTQPTPIQEAAIPPALLGRDILGCAQTGTGKTAAFVLPILRQLMLKPVAPEKSRRVRALILTPTRELALQNYETVRLFQKESGGTSAVIFGGVSQNRQTETLQSGCDVLVATPGRLLDLIGQGLLSLQYVEFFVLDEADRMLDMGFIHDVRKIVGLLPQKRQTMLFSATMPEEVECLALRLLRNPKTVKVDPVTATVDKIRQTVYFVNREDKKAVFLDLLNRKELHTVLAFVRTKSNADQYVRLLGKAGITAMAIHGNKSQNARERALESFKSGQIRVLVATDIAARGIDICELPAVINLNIPEDAETYIHRIGRTGRAGLCGIAVSLCAADELSDFRDIEKLIGKKIPVSLCEHSVTDMVPVPKQAKQPRPPRSAKQTAAGTDQPPRSVGSAAGRTPGINRKNPVTLPEKHSRRPRRRRGNGGKK